MKKRGCCAEYINDRNADLKEAWLRRTVAAANTMSRLEIVKQAVCSPARRFWVSEFEAIRVVRRMLRHGVECRCLDSRREMYTEICQRVSQIYEARGGNLNDIIIEVINQPAPGFYLTPRSAYAILIRLK